MDWRVGGFVGGLIFGRLFGWWVDEEMCRCLECEWIDGWMGGWIEEQTEGRIDRINGGTDRPINV